MNDMEKKRLPEYFVVDNGNYDKYAMRENNGIECCCCFYFQNDVLQVAKRNVAIMLDFINIQNYNVENLIES